MSSSSQAKCCPKCGAAIPAEAPQGLCPKCLLMQASFATEDGADASSKTAAPTTAELAVAFPHLEIIEIVGQGGMGFVFKARQPKLDRFVALKILPQSLAADAAFAERFSREGRLLARLNHPNIVTIHDFGEAKGFFYLLMEFVDGVNLRQAMKVGRFTPAQALAIVPKICEALQFAHNEGVLHRDIKPENILLDSKGRVKIADFGIAKLVGAERGGAGSPPLAEAGAHGMARPINALTETGKVLGTPHYMAPEQLERPHEVDQRADIYSLGVVFYEMLTGELPLGRFAPPSEKTPVDPRVDEVVLRALEKEREKRFRDAGEVKTCVETIAGSGTPAAAPQSTHGIPTRTSTCYISTPKYQRSFVGRFLYQTQGKGELRLDGDTLQFRSGWKEVTIPLRNIRAIIHGIYTIAALPGHLCYMGVTFVENGRESTFLFTPVPGRIAHGKQAVEHVIEWEKALQEATRLAMGQKLVLTSAIPLKLRWWEHAMNFVWGTLFCAVGVSLKPLLAEQRLPHVAELAWAPAVAASAIVFAHSLMRLRI